MSTTTTRTTVEDVPPPNDGSHTAEATESGDWELVSPPRQQRILTEEDDSLVVVTRPKLSRQKSASVPNLRLLDVDLQQDDNDDGDHDNTGTELATVTTTTENIPPVTNGANNSGTVTAKTTTTMIVTTTTPRTKQQPVGAWGGTSAATATATAGNVLSFRDIILSHVQDLAQEVQQKPPPKQQTPRTKIKPKFVIVKQKSFLRRCSKSMNDLQQATTAHDDDEDMIVGDTDAMEYYHRKAKGHTGRKNGKKIRPDEAKRKDMSINKRQAQRAAQQQQ